MKVTGICNKINIKFDSYLFISVLSYLLSKKGKSIYHCDGPFHYPVQCERSLRDACQFKLLYSMSYEGYRYL